MLGKGHDTIVLGDYRMNQLLEMLETNPIVAAIKDEAGLEAALKSEVGIVFVLHGDLCTLPAIVERIKLKKRMAIVHVDLIEGLSNDETVERLEKGVSTVVFWIFWIIGTGVIVFKFYERENEWLE